VDETSDLERSRLLLGWLAARRAVDHCLSDLLAAGPAGERRVRESLALVDDLETREHAAFDRYRAAVATARGETRAAEAAGGGGRGDRALDGPARRADPADPRPAEPRQVNGWGPDRPRLNLVRAADSDRTRGGLARSRSNTPGNKGHR